MYAKNGSIFVDIVHVNVIGGKTDNHLHCLYCSVFYRLVGIFRMFLQELVEVGNVKICDSLLDTNNVVMKVGDSESLGQ